MIKLNALLQSNKKKKEAPVETAPETVNPKKRIKPIILVVLVLALIGGGIFMVTHRQTSEDEIAQLAENYFNACKNGEYSTIYGYLNITDDGKYLTKDVFIDQMIAHHQIIIPEDLNASATDMHIDYETNADQSAIKCHATYLSNGLSKTYDYEIVLDADQQPKINAMDLLVTEYELVVPINTDITLNNIMLDRKNYLVENVLMQDKYKIALFKGRYPLSVKPAVGVPETTEISVGIKNDTGEIINQYQASTFQLYDTDLSTIQQRTKEFISSFYLGIGEQKGFVLNAKYFNPNLLQEIDSERALLVTNPVATYSSNGFSTSDERVNEIGIVTVKAAFTVKSTQRTSNINQNTDCVWEVTLTKSNDTWIIYDTNFGKQ